MQLKPALCIVLWPVCVLLVYAVDLIDQKYTEESIHQQCRILDFPAKIYCLFLANILKAHSKT